MRKELFTLVLIVILISCGGEKKNRKVCPEDIGWVEIQDLDIEKHSDKSFKINLLGNQIDSSFFTNFTFINRIDIDGEFSFPVGKSEKNTCLKSIQVKNSKVENFIFLLSWSVNVRKIKFSKCSISDLDFFRDFGDSLGVLDLSFNRITSINKTQLKLKDLRTLRLGNNPISSIEFNDNLKASLKLIDLSKTEFSEIPPAIFTLSNLETLNMEQVGIVKIPNAINKLSKLVTLNLGGNQIKELPNSILDLNNLTSLNISNNLIQDFPYFLSEIKSLRSLSLTGNKLDFSKSKRDSINRLFPDTEIHWGYQLNSNSFPPGKYFYSTKDSVKKLDLNIVVNKDGKIIYGGLSYMSSFFTEHQITGGNFKKDTLILNLALNENQKYGSEEELLKYGERITLKFKVTEEGLRGITQKDTCIYCGYDRVFEAD